MLAAREVRERFFSVRKSRSSSWLSVGSRSGGTILKQRRVLAVGIVDKGTVLYYSYVQSEREEYSVKPKGSICLQ